jgi:hypothetical protein
VAVVVAGLILLVTPLAILVVLAVVQVVVVVVVAQEILHQRPLHKGIMEARESRTSMCLAVVVVAQVVLVVMHLRTDVAVMVESAQAPIHLGALQLQLVRTYLELGITQVAGREVTVTFTLVVVLAAMAAGDMVQV